MNDDAWRRKFGRLRLGSIVFDDGSVTPIDWRDLMWASRAVRGEAGYYDSAGARCDAILWTMTNRLRLLADRGFGEGPAHHEPPHRLHHMLLAYCAPINPYQRTRGDEPTQARRRYYAAMAPGDPKINPAGIARVAAFLRGRISRLPYVQYVDFAACDCEGCGRDTHGPEDMRMGDCYWIGLGGRTLNERSVSIAPPPGSRGVAAASALLALGASGLLVAAR